MSESHNDMSISAADLLEKLEAEAWERIQAIAGIRTALGLPPWNMVRAGAGASVSEATRDSGPPGVIRKDAFFRMSIPDAIKKYLEMMKQPQSPKAIADGLKSGGVLSHAKKFYANVTTALSRMEAAGVLVNTSNGWGLDEWYAGRPKPVEPPKKAKKKRPASAKKKAAKAESGHPSGSHKSPSGGDAYRAFVSEHRRAGKDLKEISALWNAKKAKDKEGGK